MAKFINFLGCVFGRLTVVSRFENDKSGSSRWLCHCECGKSHVVRGSHMTQGRIKSCGCLKEDISHGLSSSKTYKTWRAMRQRCGNPKHDKYKYYGGKGITVCAKWDSFENFLTDMGERPSDAHQIDRKESNGNYEPGNCRWVTSEINNQNRSSTRMNEQAVKAIRYFFNEKGYTQIRIAKAYGIGATQVQKIVSNETWKNVSV